MGVRTLMRTRSGPLPSPISASANDHEPPRSVFCWSPRSPRSVHLELRDHDRRLPAPALLRARSEENLIRCAAGKKKKDEEEVHVEAVPWSCSPILSLGVEDSAAVSAAVGADMLQEEVEFRGGSGGRGRKISGGGRRGGGSGGGGPRREMGAYYKEMLRADPENPLLLMNYGKFLPEVEGDLDGAEDCFSRAILANPIDGEALSLYGNLMWEAHHDGERAEGYFQRALESSPEDCYMLGMYAHFLWDAEVKESGISASDSAALAAHGNSYMVEAF